MDYTQRALVDLDRIEKAANALLRAGNVCKPPVKENLLSIFDPSREVIIAKRDIGVIRGVVKPSGESWIIVVNYKLPSGAQRFAMFHEGFHILERSGAISIDGDDEYHQWLAERFAARILMPHRWVTEASAKISDIRRLCAIFEVSQTAMKRRLRELTR